MTVKLWFLWNESGGFGESNVVLYSVYIDCFCINNSYLFLNQKSLPPKDLFLHCWQTKKALLVEAMLCLPAEATHMINSKTFSLFPKKKKALRCTRNLFFSVLRCKESLRPLILLSACVLFPSLCFSHWTVIHEWNMNVETVANTFLHYALRSIPIFWHEDFSL